MQTAASGGTVDYLIIGAGIIGMAIAYELKKKQPESSIAIIEKEADVGFHASGRNSGVLHAGFYYTADSLKAKFTVEGNRRMRVFCAEQGIPVRETKKVVIAQNENEVAGIYELERRAKVNGVNVRVITADELRQIDPNVVTHQVALYSPDTASVDPKAVCQALKNELIKQGVSFHFNTPFEKCTLKYGYLVNCAGLYADKIAHRFGVGLNYILIPFKGLYMKHKGGPAPTHINVYPVPNLKNPFLGVHYTVTSDGSVKIGPSAIPAFWRENYQGLSRFSLLELLQTLYYEAKLFALNAFGFRSLAFEEMKNYHKPTFISRARQMLRSVEGDFKPMPAGIRAQLLDKKTNKLVMDFVIEKGPRSLHVLNAVSPAFTCAFSFAEYTVSHIIQHNAGKI